MIFRSCSFVSFRDWIDSKFIAHALNIYLLFRAVESTNAEQEKPSLIFHPVKLLSFLQSKTFMVFICSRVTTANWKTSRFIALSAECLPHQTLSHASSDAACSTVHISPHYTWYSAPSLVLTWPLCLPSNDGDDAKKLGKHSWHFQRFSRGSESWKLLEIVGKIIKFMSRDSLSRNSVFTKVSISQKVTKVYFRAANDFSLR